MDPTDYPPPPSVPEPPAPAMPPVAPPPPTDFTPPPPAAPEVPVPPSAAPEMPQYAPPPPPDNMPPSYAVQAAPPPKKKSKTLIIVLVILGVLLLCCAVGIVGALNIFKADSDVTTDTSVDFEVDTESETPDDTTGELESPDETGGRAEWVEFQPILADESIYAEPTAKQTALIEEIHEKLYPGFKIEDTLAEPGVEDADSYHPDILYVKASLESDPDVRIAYYMWTDSEASTAGGVHLTEEQAESYETLAQSSSGTYYIYDHENLIGLMEGSVDERMTAVLAQAEQEFPGYVAFMIGEDGDNIGAVLTRWSAFPDLEDGLAVTFEPDGSGWAVVDITDW